MGGGELLIYLLPPLPPIFLSHRHRLVLLLLFHLHLRALLSVLFPFPSPSLHSYSSSINLITREPWQKRGKTSKMWISLPFIQRRERKDGESIFFLPRPSLLFSIILSSFPFSSDLIILFPLFFFHPFPFSAVIFCRTFSPFLPPFLFSPLVSFLLCWGAQSNRSLSPLPPLPMTPTLTRVPSPSCHCCCFGAKLSQGER